MTGIYQETNINRIRGAKHISADYEMTFDDDLVVVSTEHGPVAVTLPTAEQIPGQYLSVKADNAGTHGNAVTIIPRPGEKIDGMESISLTANEAGCLIQSDGENWRCIPSAGEAMETAPAGGEISGSAGGALAGTYPDPTFAAFGPGAAEYRPFSIEISEDGRVVSITPTIDEFSVDSTFRANFTTTPIVGHSWTTSELPAGVYEITAQVVWSLDSGTVDFESRIRFDGASITPFEPYHVEEPKDAAGTGVGGTDQRLPRSYPAGYVTVSTGGSPHVIEFLFNKSGGGKAVEAALHHSVLRLRRVG